MLTVEQNGNIFLSRLVRKDIQLLEVSYKCLQTWAEQISK